VSFSKLPFIGPAELAAQLQAALPLFQHIQWVPQTGSTNEDLLNKARASRPGTALRPWLLGTHLQTQGRGRSGRTWQNRVGASLMFSCAYDLFLPTRHLPALSPLCGLIACETLRQWLHPAQQHRLSMKWPNDILWDNAKLAGILIDVSRAGVAASADHHIVIIGIGLNLNDGRALSQSLNRQIADWAEIERANALTQTVTPANLVSHLASGWYDALNTVTSTGLCWLPSRYATVDALIGQAVTIVNHNRITHSGIACGINTDGQLLLRSGAEQAAISVGDVSLRPLTEHP